MLKDNIKKPVLDTGLTQIEVAEKLGVAQASMLDGRVEEETQRTKL